LTRTIEEAIVVKVIDKFDNKTACTYSDLTDFVFETFGVSVSSQLIQLVVKRSTDVKAFLAYPMDNDPVECPTEDIDAHCALLEEELRQMPASLVCNLDEMGWAEYQVAQPITIAVPSSFPDELPYPVDRARRRLTILHCLFADESYTTSLIIPSPRTIDDEVFRNGYTPDKVFLRFQENSLTTQDLFMEWAMMILFPEIELRRVEICRWIPDFGESPIVILYGLTQHVCNPFLDVCFEGYIIPHMVPFHSSDQV
jgi:hypothetical protein